MTLSLIMILAWRFWLVILSNQLFILLTNCTIPPASMEMVEYGYTTQMYSASFLPELILGPDFTANKAVLSGGSGSATWLPSYFPYNITRGKRVVSRTRRLRTCHASPRRILSRNIEPGRSRSDRLPPPANLL